MKDKFLYPFFLVFLGLMNSSLLFSQVDSVASEREKVPVKEAVKAHMEWYGFVRNYFTYDSRENIGGTADLFTYLPKDHNYNL